MSAVLITLCSACAGVQQKQPDMEGYIQIDRNETKSMLQLVLDINNKGPESGSVSFFVNGNLAGKKFKSDGSADFTRSPRMCDIIFKDYVFKSVISRLIQDNDAISILFPVEKKLYKDHASRFNIANYAPVKIDYQIIYSIATGIIPLIKDFKISKGLYAGQNGKSLIILENPEFFETISFSEGMPDKLLFVEKAAKKRVEIFLISPQKIKESIYFKKIKIISKDDRLEIDLIFNKFNINVPVKIKTIDEIDVPKNIKIITM
jgi:hypothetical protein